jgi:hypothetical protein
MEVIGAVVMLKFCLNRANAAFESRQLEFKEDHCGGSYTYD